jgi:predicted HTH domain antitoxin
MHRITLELPEELFDLLGSPEEAAAKARESLVLDLLREARLSQGQAARLLGITRWDLLEVMGRHQIPSGPASADELLQDVEAARRAARSA